MSDGESLVTNSAIAPDSASTKTPSWMAGDFPEAVGIPSSAGMEPSDLRSANLRLYSTPSSSSNQAVRIAREVCKKYRVSIADKILAVKALSPRIHKILCNSQNDGKMKMLVENEPPPIRL